MYSRFVQNRFDDPDQVFPSTTCDCHTHNPYSHDPFVTEDHKLPESLVSDGTGVLQQDQAGWNSYPNFYNDHIVHPNRGTTVSNPDDTALDDQSFAPSATASSPVSPCQGTSQKRKTQNRLACAFPSFNLNEKSINNVFYRNSQRAYRERQNKYRADLEAGIREIQQNMERLQGENFKLFCELLKMRVANDDIQNVTTEDDTRGHHECYKYQGKLYPGIPDALKKSTSSTSNRVTQSPSAESQTAQSSSAESRSLDEHFAAIWNLISSEPSLVNGAMCPQAFLDKLKQKLEQHRGTAAVQNLSTTMEASQAGR